MNRNMFLNKEVINKNNEKGLVLFFDEEYLIVKYENEQKKYSKDIALKNKYLVFVDESINKQIEQDLLNKEERKIEHEELISNNHQAVVLRNKKIISFYNKLYFKTRFLKTLFGKDFKYPPFIKFKKKYKYLIRENPII